MSEKKKPLVNIYNWKIESGPSLGESRLTGIAVDDPSLPPGDYPVTITAIVHKSLPNIVETKTTIYLLGKPATETASTVPGAIQHAVTLVAAKLMQEVEREAGMPIALVVQLLGMSMEQLESSARTKAQATIDLLMENDLLKI